MNDVKELMQLLVEQRWLEAPKNRNSGYKLILTDKREKVIYRIKRRLMIKMNSNLEKVKELIGEENYNRLLLHGYFPIEIDFFKMIFYPNTKHKG